MEKKYDPKLRSKAEQLLNDSLSIENGEEQSLLYELKVHQIELEIQNEELRKNQNVLQGERKRYENLFDYAPIGYFVINDAGVIQNVNFAGSDLLKIVRIHLINKPFILYLKSEEHTGFFNYLKQIFESQVTHVREFEMVNREGKTIYTRFSGRYFEENHGEDKAILSISDISDRVAYEREIRHKEEQYRAVVDQAYDGIIIMERNGIVLDLNQHASQLLGIEKNEMLGTDISEMVDESFRESFLAAIRQLKEKDTFISEYSFLKSNADSITGEISIARLSDGRIIGILRDVSHRKQLEESLHKARETAEEASRLKSDFLARMSHEIRTPINAVLGMAELAMDTDLNDEQTQYLETCHASASSLLLVVNDILDFSRIEANQFTLFHDVFDFHGMAKAVFQPYRIQGEKKKLEMTLHLDDEVPRYCIGDGNRIRQVLGNLLSNAIKYTEKGSIDLLVSSERKKGKTVSILFEVRDTGIGISEEDTASVFDSFNQVDESYSRSHDGSGLGLSIVKNLVQLMDGRVWLESRSGSGSSFFVQLDLPESENMSEQEMDEKEDIGFPQELSILLAEDNGVNAMYVQKLFEKQGVRIDHVRDGADALRVLSEKRYDIVLMDISMPNMDGMEVTRRIRNGESGEDSRSLPIIALTAHSLQGDRERFLAAGMNGYVEKPVSQKKLFRQVRELLYSGDPEHGGQNG